MNGNFPVEGVLILRLAGLARHFSSPPATDQLRTGPLFLQLQKSQLTVMRITPGKPGTFRATGVTY